jgi:hypothetical protein
MPVSVMLTYVPEMRGEVHSEHKLSILSALQEWNIPQVV